MRPTSSGRCSLASVRRVSLHDAVCNCPSASATGSSTRRHRTRAIPRSRRGWRRWRTGRGSRRRRWNRTCARAHPRRAAFSASRAAWSFHSGEISSMAGSYSPTAAAAELRAARQAVRRVLGGPSGKGHGFPASSWSPSLERSVPYVNPSRCPVMTRRPIPFEDACSSCSTSPSRTRTEASRVRSAYASASAAPALRASLTSCSQVSSRSSAGAPYRHVVDAHRGSPTPTGTACPSLPQVPRPGSCEASEPTALTFLSASGPNADQHRAFDRLW